MIASLFPKSHWSIACSASMLPWISISFYIKKKIVIQSKHRFFLQPNIIGDILPFGKWEWIFLSPWNSIVFFFLPSKLLSACDQSNHWDAIQNIALIFLIQMIFFSFWGGFCVSWEPNDTKEKKRKDILRVRGVGLFLFSSLFPSPTRNSQFSNVRIYLVLSQWI